MRIVTTAILLASLLPAPGCRHYAGWVDKQVRTTPLDQEVSVAAVERFDVLVEHEPNGDDGALEARAVVVCGGWRTVRRELIGHRTYVRYHWSVPLFKPLVAVTVFFPFYLAYIDPHNHGGANWGRLDYLRDVIGYFNFFEAWPNGSQRVEAEWTVLWSETAREHAVGQELPLVGARLEVRVGEQVLATLVSGRDGMVSFDIRPHLTPELAEADREFRVSLMDDGRPKVTKAFTLKRDVLRKLTAER